MQLDLDDLQSMRPYAELSGLDARLLQVAFESYFVRRRPLSVEELEHAAQARPQAAGHLFGPHRLLERDGEGKVRPNLLGLVHASGDSALALCREVDSLLRAASRLYEPGSPRIPVDDVFRAAHVDVAQLDLLTPLLRDAGLQHWNGDFHVQPSLLAPGGLAQVVPRLAPGRRRNAEGEPPDPAVLEPPGPFDLRWTGLEVSRFRALRDLRLDFPSRLTVLVGVNGAGKSTALDACAFVTRALLEGLPEAVEAEHGLSRLRSRGTSGPVRVRARFEVDLGAGVEPGEYAFAVDERHENLMVEQETLRVGVGAGAMEWLARQRAVGIVRNTQNAEKRIYAPLDDLLLDKLGAQDFVVAQGICCDLGRALLVDRDPQFARTDVGSNRPDSTHPRARSRTRWAAGIDDLLDAAVPDQRAADRLATTLAELVPTVREVRRLPETDAPARFEVVEVDSPEPARLDELSAGMRQMVLLAAVYLHPEPPSLLLLEEPESGIHVGAFPALRDLLRSIARRTTVLATSHSPLFVALLDPSREVLVLERDGHGVHARPLEAARQSRTWLEAFADPLESYVRLAMERPR